MAVYGGQGNLVPLASLLPKYKEYYFCVGVVAAFYLICQSYRAKSKYVLKSATHSGLAQDDCSVAPV